MDYHQFIEGLGRDIKEFQRKASMTAEVLSGNLDCFVATTPADVVYTEDTMRLLHYHRVVEKEKQHPIPILIVYALINRYIMLDLEPGRSFIQNLLNGGLDIYLIDWGYPSGPDRYLDLSDYVGYYMDKAVDEVKSETGVKNINLMGVCQGGTFSVIYSALNREKIKNLITIATPVQFDVDDAVLFSWARELDADKAVEALGNLPGDLANILYLLATPAGTVDKYIQFIKGIDDPKFVNTFLRMEKWIFDSPDMAGEVFRQYIKDLLQQNLLIKNELVLDGKRVDLTNIECPLLNVFGKKDSLSPPSSAQPLSDAVGSKDVTTLGVDTGHVGIFVGSTSYKTIIPKIVEWIKSR